MPQSLTNFDAALKDDYGPGLRESINNNNVIWTEASRNDEDIVGRQAVWSVHTGRSTSTGARSELGTLPTADRQRYSQAKENLAFLYHTIKVSGPAKQLTRNDTGSFVRALESEISGAEKDLKNDCNRQSFGDAITINSVVSTGVIFKVSSDNGSGVITCLAPDGTAVTAPEIRSVFVNMTVDCINGTTGAVRSTGTITAVSAANGTITTNSGVSLSGITGNDFIVRQGAFNAEMLGLRAWIKDTGTIANINPSTVPTWAAVKVGSTTTAISEVILDQAAEGVETDGDGGTPNLFISDHSQRRKLASLMQAQKRYDGKEVTLTAGWIGLSVARGTLVADRYCPATLVFAINPKELVRFVGLDFTWDEDDGKVLYKALDGSDAIEARFKSYQNLVTPNRNSHALISLAKPTGVGV
jgi:hypothetical protein